jgi:hypothetical protein
MPFAVGNQLGARVGRKPGVPNKASGDVRALAQRYGPAVIKGLYKLWKEAESEQARIMAGRELLDRGYGKAHQSTDVTIGPALPAFDPTQFTAEQLQLIEQALRLLLGRPAMGQQQPMVIEHAAPDVVLQPDLQPHNHDAAEDIE